MTTPAAATYSVPAAAALLGVSKFTLYRAVNRGDIIAIKIGRCTQIPAHVVDRLLADGNNQAAS
jgi:excisionase family DNA binding protein